MKQLDDKRIDQKDQLNQQKQPNQLAF